MLTNIKKNRLLNIYNLINITRLEKLIHKLKKLALGIVFVLNKWVTF